MLKTQVYWLVIKTVAKGIKANISNSYIQNLLQELINFTSPDDLQLSVAFLQFSAKVRTDWNSYLKFNIWANITKVSDVTMLERLLIPIAKTLLDISKHQSFDNVENIFFEWIKEVSEKHQELFYVKYYYVKLLLQLANFEEAKILALNLVKTKPKEFWVWHLLALCFQNSPTLQFSAYAKALSCGGQEEMLIGLRLELAEKLINRGNWANAKYEIEKIKIIRIQNGWSIPEKIKNWEIKQEFQSAISSQMDYAIMSMEIEDFLWADNPSFLVVLTEINQKTKTAFYWSEDQGGGKIDLKKLLAPELKLGLSYKAFYKKHALGYNMILKLENSNQDVEWCSGFEGHINVLSSGIGFVDQIFISNKLIENNKLNNKMPVIGFAAKIFDNKKQKMGWKAIKIKIRE